MNFLYISASNMMGVESKDSASYKICEAAKDEIQKRYKDARHTILELKYCSLSPCVGCGKCWASHRCTLDNDFNGIYQKIIDSDLILFVSPHYAPIPAKLTVLLEKMEQITFLHWGKDHSYRSEVYGKLAGIISHGGGEAWALKSYKRMVNDTIANALDTIQLKLIPYNEEWDTGISLPVSKAAFAEKSIFPTQEYDWTSLRQYISDYAGEMIKNILHI